VTQFILFFDLYHYFRIVLTLVIFRLHYPVDPQLRFGPLQACSTLIVADLLLTSATWLSMLLGIMSLIHAVQSIKSDSSQAFAAFLQLQILWVYKLAAGSARITGSNGISPSTTST
jgi:hypothetical protein